ncbi:peptidase C65 Otubain-domain-containing protein [Radiomyces spectabilis]|uniref:peptidase C65 Otubain-domain-containing protein n=1 Tax=Radiomyces spectabilis TaxID=64574 RepID=UPI002220E116|nr:peptidase C65 Otubain-domain-containing protein [Radiomyces spectabilis]KAI8388433.1 peptidase C65 Otubain-domain-containing protein [Radiomyces spectabilis]
MSTEQRQEPELTDEQILQFEQRIKDEEAQRIPLVCQAEPLSHLEEEYKDNEPFLRKVKNLNGDHQKIRKCRGDGNCFFRAFAFAWFESVLQKRSEYVTNLATLKSTTDLLEMAGFQKLAYEDFYDVTLEQFQQLPQWQGDTDLLLANFQSEEISNAIVMHLRFVTSAYLRMHADEYEPFLVVEMISIEEFCAMHVEAFGRESDHLQITALSNALNIPVQVIYLDGSNDDVAAVHEFWPSNTKTEKVNPLRLIYRPGHYDILY